MLQTLQETLANARLRKFYRIAVINTALNPLFYAVWYQHFRQGLARLVTEMAEKYL